jgi:CubicO group peptidase (beta-lactamase class C family)
MMFDWQQMISAIEGFRPWFGPGPRNAYHTLVWGWLIGELVQRTDAQKRSFSEFVRDEVLQPLGIVNFYVGLPEQEVGRVATLEASWEPAVDPDHLREAAMPVSVAAAPPVHNRHDTWKACLPGAGGIADALSVARLFAMLANKGELDGTRLLSVERVESFRRPRDESEQDDATFETPVWIGQGGYWLGGDLRQLIPTDGSYPTILNQPGAGGSTGWAELDTGLAVAICHNRQFVVDRRDRAFRARLTPIADAVRAVASEYEEYRRQE